MVNGMLFRATTLKPGSWRLPDIKLKRERLLHELSSSPSVSLIVGSVGSGKSTLALQWANDIHEDVLYLSARPREVEIEQDTQVSSPFGDALQKFLNVCISWSDRSEPETIPESLRQVMEYSQGNSQALIIDDLELIPGSAHAVLQQALEALSSTKPKRKSLLLSRKLEIDIIGELRRYRLLHVVMPHSLAFDQNECRAAHEIGIFGNASLEQIEWARERSAGWITGMFLDLQECGGSRSAERFRQNIVSNIMLARSHSALLAMFASASIPFISTGMWEKWLSSMGEDAEPMATMLTQFPFKANAEHGLYMELVPAFRDAITELRPIRIPEPELRKLLTLAIEWYVSENLPVVARGVALQHHLEAEYLNAVRPKIVDLAKSENWEAISSLVHELPIEILSLQSDIILWRTFGLSGAGKWSESSQIFEHVDEAWSNSEDPLVRGRHFLLSGFMDRSRGNYQSAMTSFEQAYETLPESIHQDRLYATASAAIVALHLNDLDANSVWSRRSALELAHLPPRQRWWHSNPGPIGLGLVASRGHIDQVYTQARLQVRTLQEENQDLSWRYLLLMASIDTERMRFDSVAEILERAEPHLHTWIHHSMFSIEKSRFLMAQDHYHDAAVTLEQNHKIVGSAINNSFRKLVAKAELAYESGDPERAGYILEVAAWPADAIPRNFGDAHPLLIQALVRSASGKHEEALRSANQARDETRIRQHLHLEIRSHIVLAQIYDHMDQVDLRDDHIHTANGLDAANQFRRVYFVQGRDLRKMVASPTSDLDSMERLTTRELEILGLLAQSLSNQQIADQLFISVSTVKNHLARSYHKLGTNSRKEAVRIARSLGLLGS